MTEIVLPERLLATSHVVPKRVISPRPNPPSAPGCGLTVTSPGDESSTRETSPAGFHDDPAPAAGVAEHVGHQLAGHQNHVGQARIPDEVLPQLGAHR